MWPVHPSFHPTNNYSQNISSLSIFHHVIPWSSCSPNWTSTPRQPTDWSPPGCLNLEQSHDMTLIPGAQRGPSCNLLVSLCLSSPSIASLIFQITSHHGPSIALGRGQWTQSLSASDKQRARPAWDGSWQRLDGILFDKGVHHQDVHPTSMLECTSLAWETPALDPWVTLQRFPCWPVPWIRKSVEVVLLIAALSVRSYLCQRQSSSTWISNIDNYHHG